MKKIKKRIKSKPVLISIIIFLFLFLLSSVCLIYSILKISNIENILRYLVVILILLILTFNILEVYKLIFKGKTPGILLFGLVLLILFTIESYTCGIINGIYTSIDNIYKDSHTYESSVITMSSNNFKKISDVKSSKIGIISNESSIDGYTIPNEIIKENSLEKTNEVIKFDTVSDVVRALYKGEINVAIVSSTYDSMLANVEGYNNIKSETKEIYSKTKTVKKSDTTVKKDDNDPFTILVLGVDTISSDISKVTSFNADSLMLITFNPKTYNATILSIPRDTYVPITCINNSPSSKITHSGWYGEKCVIKTIEDWMGIDIDYYVKINFLGVVNLVDAIDGITLDVPYSFCEQNSNRKWGKNTVYVKKGKQTINGEQALALSRNRHPNGDVCGAEWGGYNSNDIIRGQNQQLVINAIINKITKNIDLNKINSILNVIGKNMDTNMTTNEMLSYYNLAKNIALNSLNDSDNVITFERLYLKTYGKYLYDPLLKLSLSDQIYYKDSLNAVLNEMKINLETVKPEMIKTFSFSAKTPYKEEKIGEGIFNQNDIKTVPSFKGKDKTIALNWGKENNIKVNIEYEEVETGTNDFVLSQSIPATYIFSNIKPGTELNITVAKVKKEKNPTENNNNKQDKNDGNLDYPTE